MIRGLYTAASGLISGERIQDMLSNNMANVNTNGFKGQDGLMRSFPETLLYSMNDHTGSGPGGINPINVIGSVGQGAFLQEMLPRFTQGVLKPSDNPYAYAIEDTVPAEVQDANGNVTNLQSLQRSFFPIEGPNGTLYTRDGNFTLDDAGFLKTQTGGYLQAVDNVGQAIPQTRVGQDPQTHQLRAYQLNPQTGLFDTPVGPNPYDVRIVTVDNAEKMTDEGNGVFNLQTAQVVPNRQAGVVRNKFVEGSNVDPAQTMVSMMNVMRSYEANTRVIRTLDQTLQKACNDVGRV